MTLFEKITTLLKAKAHQALDRLETPEVLYETALLEGEAAVAAARNLQRTALADQLRLEDERTRAAEQVQIWETRASAALSSGDEALAREALKMSLRYQQETEARAAELEQARLNVATAKGQVATTEKDLADMVARKAFVLAQIHAAQILDPFEPESPTQLFDRMKNKAERAYYEGEAAQQLAEEALTNQKRRQAEEAALREQFAKLDAEQGPSQAVKDKLAALKAKLQSS